MKVEEVMTREVITARIDDSVEKCARLLLENQVGGLPVLDRGERVVGMLTEGDLIRRASRLEVPRFLEILGGLVYLDDPLEFMEELRRSMALRAGRLMSREVVKAAPSDSLESAATKMVRHGISRLPVVDEDDRLLGIISRRDIMAALYREGEEKKEDAATVTE